MEQNIITELTGMIEQVKAITKQELARLSPEVDSIIKNRSKDQHRIESLLDRLLDCAGMDNDGLVLFKKLCRYYYGINPVAVADYVRFYHEIYGEDSTDDKIDDER